MEIFILLAAIALLLGLILIFKFHAFPALLTTAISIGLMAGMSPLDTLKSVQSGVASTMGSLILVVALGAMLGKILATTGATQQITNAMIKTFGIKNIKWAMVLTGLIVGIAMYYNAGFVVLIPLVFIISQNTQLPLLYVALPMCTALSVTHGFLPPHPGPTAVVEVFKANLGLTLIYGLILTIPAIFVGGVLFPEFIKNIKTEPSDILKSMATHTDAKPNTSLSILVAILPVLLMALSSAADLFIAKDHAWFSILHFIGDPTVSILISVILALYLIGKKSAFSQNMSSGIDAIGSVAVILLVIAAGGAFKQVLVDSGIGQKLAEYVKYWPVPTVLLAWLSAALLRVVIGSATVASMMAAGIVAPLIIASGASPELCVLAIGSGSLFFSHLNDTGFWMFKEYFGLSVKETLKTWTVMETLVSVIGLGGVLILDIWI